VLGCAASEPAGEPAAAPPAASAGAEQAAAEPPDRAHHMQHTFWMAVRARDAVAANDLAAAKVAARELEQYDYGATLPESWKPWVAQMKQQAGELVLAAGVEDAGRAVGALGLSCGNCHHAQKAGPTEEREPPVAWKDPPDTVTERMDRHYEGIEQLWQGLVQPSEEAWRSGTTTLTRAPLSPPQAKEGAVDPGAASAIERVRELARRARAASSHKERAAVYGELIAGCGHCHMTAHPDTR
jgi:hypothetical protein